jgi:hypothetical protein
MLTQDFALRIKQLDDEGTFTGYGSTYGGPPDLVGDVIEPGAFTQSIASQGKGYPLLWVHDQSQPLGLAKVSDSPTGLVVNGSMVMSDPAAQRALAHMKAGSVRGLSIGYDVPHGSGKVAYGDDGSRTLKEIKLYELSLCAIPANPRAQVTSVKSLSDIEALLQIMRKSGDADRPTLLAIRSELTRLLSAAPDDEEAAQQAAEELKAMNHARRIAEGSDSRVERFCK